MPTLFASIVAEARLLWQLAPRLRFLLLAAGLAGLVPGDPGRVAAMLFLLALAPVLAESGARERLLGTLPLVRTLPGVPATGFVSWKAAAALLLATALAAPTLLAFARVSPLRALAFACGLTFTALAAVSLGALSGGGRLFLGAATALWYAAVNGALDYAGVFAPQPGLVVPAAFALGAVGALVIATLADQARGARA